MTPHWIALFLIALGAPAYASDEAQQALDRCEFTMDPSHVLSRAKNLERVGKSAEAYEVLWQAFSAFRGHVIPPEIIQAFEQWRQNYGFNFVEGQQVAEGVLRVRTPERTRTGAFILEILNKGPTRFDVRSAEDLRLRYSVELQGSETALGFKQDETLFEIVGPSLPHRLFSVYEPGQVPAPAVAKLLNSGPFQTTSEGQFILGNFSAESEDPRYTNHWIGVFRRDGTDLSDSYEFAGTSVLSRFPTENRAGTGFIHDDHSVSAIRNSDLSTLFSLSSGRVNELLGKHLASYLFGSMSLDRWILTIPSMNPRFVILDRTGQPISGNSTIDQVMHPPQFSPDGRQIAYFRNAAKDGNWTLEIQDSYTGAVLASIPTPRSHTQRVRYSADGRHLITGGTNGHFIYRTSDYVRTAEFPDSTEITQSPDGTYLVVVADKRPIEIYSYDGIRLAELYSEEEARRDGVSEPVFVRDGNRILFHRHSLARNNEVREFRWAR